MANWKQIKLWVGSTLVVLLTLVVVGTILAFIVGLIITLIDWRW